tara:strand:+ start:198 stop:431 length:234 start_codon:yes stop_codon:yes gene_type:complete
MINKYEVLISVDGQKSVITLDDTYPAINSWAEASSFAVLMAQHDYPDSHVEFISCSEYIAEEYEQYGYIFDAPMAVQ